jgi:hypothetical protein
MTEDQIMQRVAENQKRVFSDIDRSKPSKDSSGGFNIVGANGVTIQGSGKEAAISIDTEAVKGSSGEQGLAGERGEQGLQGEQGPQGQQGIQGDAGQQGEAGETGEKGDTGDKGDKGDSGDQGEQGLPGASVTEAQVGTNFVFTFTLSDGSQITTNAPINGEGILVVTGGGVSVIPISDGLLTGSGGGLTWSQLQTCN